MDNEISNAAKKLYESIEEIIYDYNNLLNMMNDLDKKWDIYDNNNQDSSVQELESELQNLKPQIMRTVKKCVVFGKTSVGKSTFINALLREKILPSGCGPTTKNVCEIKASSKDNNYLLVDGSNREHRLDEISEINGQTSNENLENRPYIHLFYDRQRCELLNEDVVIIDTPATDTHIGLDKDVEILCREADVIILLVNAMGTLQLSDSAFITRNKTIFSMLTVLIVYTWWDLVQQDDDYESIRESHFKNAKDFLCTELNYSEDVAKSNIYFLSCKERLEMVSQKSTGIPVGNNDSWTQRKIDFDIFFQVLKRKLSENAVVRKHNYLQTVYSKLSATIFNPESLINQISRKINVLVNKMKSILPNVNKINKEINAEISKIIESAIEDFILKGIEIKEESNEKLYELLEAVIDRSMGELKRKIMNLVRDEDERIYLIRKKILQEIYFPNYLDMTDEKSSKDISSMNRNLSLIRKKTRIGTIVAGACVTAGSLAFCGYIAGAAGAAGLAIELGLGARVLSRVCLAGASALAGGTSVGVLTAFKKKVCYMWKEDIKNMKTNWNALEIPLLDSYSKFINNLDEEISQFFSPIQDESENIENKLEVLKEELDVFLNFSHIF